MTTTQRPLGPGDPIAAYGSRFDAYQTGLGLWRLTTELGDTMNALMPTRSAAVELIRRLDACFAQAHADGLLWSDGEQLEKERVAR